MLDLRTYFSKNEVSNLFSPPGELNPYQEPKKFIRHARAASFKLPTKIKNEILEFRSYGNQPGFILLKGLPFETDLCETPIDNKEAAERGCYISEFCISMFGSLLGDMYAFAQESEGLLFNNIRPTFKNTSKQSSESSGVYLELHTEVAFHEFRPDFLILNCLRKDPERQAKTGVSSIRLALPLLSKETKECLFQPLYSFAYDLSFGNEHGKKNSIKRASVLQGPKDDPYLTYDSDLITPHGEKASLAIDELEKALRSTMQTFRLQEGELLLVDNRRTAHSRTSFKARFDGKDRWLQRSFVRQDFDSVRKRLPHQGYVIRDII
ncbi:TauD/TfdA family dioxygenase [Halomonas faecis]|uniref:TauD/TfdA family dioxygenase n=1 Tax=Halomonas faecis TaxID=1562110 RepID=UPI0013D48055|nr:TauD/TfdA family dioxygenase [Halomonas faecis]